MTRPTTATQMFATPTKTFPIRQVDGSPPPPLVRTSSVLRPRNLLLDVPTAISFPSVGTGEIKAVEDAFLLQGPLARGVSDES